MYELYYRIPYGDGRIFGHSGMQYYLRFVLLFASMCGVFPVKKVYSTNIERVTFAWMSVVTTYSFLLLCGYLTVEIYSLDYTVRNLNEDNLTAKGKSQINATRRD